MSSIDRDNGWSHIKPPIIVKTILPTPHHYFLTMSVATILFLTICATAPLSLPIIRGVHLIILPAWWRRNSTHFFMHLCRFCQFALLSVCQSEVVHACQCVRMIGFQDHLVFGSHFFVHLCFFCQFALLIIRWEEVRTALINQREFVFVDGTVLVMLLTEGTCWIYQLDCFFFDFPHRKGGTITALNTQRKETYLCLGAINDLQFQ